MEFQERYYPESRFGGFTDLDGTIRFYCRVNALVSKSSLVLDVGCGRGAHQEDPNIFRRELRNLRNRANSVIGIDVDSAGYENPAVDEFRCIDGLRWPINDEEVDIVLCDYVLEHIKYPEEFFSEVYRVLRKGGYFCARTTNRWNYIGIAASIVPNKYHSKVTSISQSNRNEEDVFPTTYKCNSTRKLRKLMRRHSLEHVVYTYESEPKYLEFSGIAYWFGVMHQKWAPSFLRPTIFMFGRK